MTRNDSRTVAQFLFKDIICRHGIFRKCIIDRGPENKSLSEALIDRYGIKRVVTSAYHPQANGMAKRGFQPLVNSLAKLTTGPATRSWVTCLPIVIWADRTTVRASIGMTPYEFEYATRPVLPIELRYPTWNVLEWDQVRDEANLVVMRARALQRREEDLDEARLFLRRMRERNKEYFDGRRVIRREELNVGDRVLLWNRQAEIDMSTKLKMAFKWLGPYLISEADKDKGTYKLKDLQGAALTGTFPGVHLKRFYLRSEVLGHPFEGDRAFAMVENADYEEEEEEEEEEEVGQSETIEDDVGTTGFRIEVPPVMAQMRREYEGAPGDEPTVRRSRGRPQGRGRGRR